ncbi:membrane protein insertion efficiency factor YidD [Pseudomonas rossensis]|uniref:membrane protein insertion efficiency factor YidD n=1 Tax=Pseudomonas rossensis TaxID=2305471 RepID=UPI0032619EF8
MICWLSFFAIRFYQRIAPSRLRDACRFDPSCSNYALLAIEKHGAVRGWKMALSRIHRCRFPNGGEDYP